MIYQRHISSDMVEHPHHSIMASEFHQFFFYQGHPLGWGNQVKWTIYDSSCDRTDTSCDNIVHQDPLLIRVFPAQLHSFTAPDSKLTWPISNSDLGQGDIQENSLVAPRKFLLVAMFTPALVCIRDGYDVRSHVKDNIHQPTSVIFIQLHVLNVDKCVVKRWVPSLG